jgi:hypothetical protein
VTAGENEPQAVVGNLDIVVFRLFSGRGKLVGELRFDFFGKPGLAAQAVDCLVASSLDDPGSRMFRDAGCSPLVQGDGKCFLGGLFGQVEVTQQTD